MSAIAQVTFDGHYASILDKGPHGFGFAVSGAVSALVIRQTFFCAPGI
jgi:hypothetical protein